MMHRLPPRPLPIVAAEAPAVARVPSDAGPHPRGVFRDWSAPADVVRLRIYRHNGKRIVTLEFEADEWDELTAYRLSEFLDLRDPAQLRVG